VFLLGRLQSMQWLANPTIDGGPNVMKKPIDDSWIWKPGIDRLEDVYDTSDSDPPEDEEPCVWAELNAVSPSDPFYAEKTRKIHAKNLRWVQEFLSHLPVVRAQDAERAMNDPRWLDEDRIQKRAENRERVARQRAKARATDLDAYRKSEREGRARRRKAERLRTPIACTPLSVRETAHERS
jgi:hypothetical protein